MEQKMVIKNRFAATLFAMLMCVVIFGCAVWANFRAQAEDDPNPEPSYAYTLAKVDVAPSYGWIFTKSTQDDMLYKMVDVTVTYKDGYGTELDSVKLAFTGKKEGAAYVAETGEQVTFAKAVAEKVTITVNVTPKKDATYDEGVSGEATTEADLSAESTHVQNGIFAEFTSYSGTVYSSTNINDVGLLSAINVYVAYNDGTRDSSPDGRVGQYQLSGNFFPENYTDPSEYIGSDKTYNKVVTVTDSYNSNYSTTVEWKGIHFQSPDRVLGFVDASRLPAHDARVTEVNTEGVFVRLQYDVEEQYEGILDPVIINVPLAAFNIGSQVEFTYYNNSLQDVTKDGLTTAVKRIRILFTYPGKESDPEKTTRWQASRTLTISVNPLKIHVPDFPDMGTTVVSWNEGASITIKKWDYASLFDNDPPDPKIEVSPSSVNGQNATVDYNEDDTVTITFPAPGRAYTVTAKLDVDDDFQWDKEPAYVTRIDSNTLQITVQVEKGKPEVTMGSIGDVKYGIANKTGGLITSAEVDGEELEKATWTYVAKTPTNENDYATDSNAWHYYLEFYTTFTKYGDEGNVLAKDDPAVTMRSDGLPQTVGTYYAVVVTYENGGYLSMPSTNYATFNITQFEIKTTVASRAYRRPNNDGDKWTINELLGNDGVHPTVNSFPYGDEATKILNITDVTDGKSDTVSDTTYYWHANAYTLNVSVKTTGDYSKNYTLGAATQVKFNITTYEGSTFEVDATGWTYGTGSSVKPNIVINNAGDPYYYASKTGSNFDVDTDFEVKYYKYSGSAGSSKTPIPDTDLDFTKWNAGLYAVELKAKHNGNYDETSDFTSGTKIDYKRFTATDDFEVVAKNITAPTLSAPWVESGNSAQTVYQYKDGAASDPFTIIDWIGDSNNTAADGSSKIITLTITYAKYYTTAETAATEGVTVTNDKFTVTNAGDYTVTFTLNGNYSWSDREDPKAPYSYVGKVDRQELPVLQNTDITGAYSEYNGSAQTKTVGAEGSTWNSKALELSGITAAALETGHKYIDADYSVGSGNTFEVRNAAKYTVTVIIKESVKDNYIWNDSTLAPIKLEYSLQRAAITVTWADDDANNLAGKTDRLDTPYPRFVFDGAVSEQKRPTATVTVLAVDDDVTAASYTLYSDEFNNSITSITQKGFYYISVATIEGAAAGNYYVPENPTADFGTIFEIYAKTFAKPVFEREEEGREYHITYSGAEFDPTTLFNYAYFQIGSSYRVSLLVSAELRGETEVLNVNKYTIVININDDNFDWDAGVTLQDRTFTIVVEAKDIRLEWLKDDLKAIYDPDPNQIYKPTYGTDYVFTEFPTVDNGKVAVMLQYKLGGTGDYIDEVKDAGSYTVYATAIVATSEDDEISALNYVLGPLSTTSHSYIVQKQFVNKAGLEKAAAAFEGTGDSVKFTSASYQNYLEAKVRVEITGRVPASWALPTPGLEENTIVTIDNIPGVTFADEAGFVFNYTRAGYYSFTFYLDGKNFYWEGDSATEAERFDFTGEYSYRLADDAFKVSRQELTAISIKEWRSREFDKMTSIDGYYDGYYDHYFDNKTLPATGVSYSKSYGKEKDATPTSNDWLAWDPNPGEDGAKNGLQGIYYVELTLTATSGNILNYVWVPNGQDLNSDGDGYLYGNADIFSYSEDSVTVRIFYAITLGQLEINIRINSYYFGENGYVNGEEGSVKLEKGEIGDTKIGHVLGDVDTAPVYVTLDSSLPYGVETYQPWIVDDAYFAVKVNGTSDWTKVPTLERNLPWDAGTYDLRCTLRFGDGTFYEDRPVNCTFTVKKREIKNEHLTWGGLTHDYDNTSKMATATLTTEIYKDADHETKETNYAGAKFLTISVSSKDGTDNLVSAGSHDIKAEISWGEGTHNFYIDGDSIANTLTINRATATVSANTPSKNHVYGDVISDEEKKYTPGDGFDFNDDADKEFTVNIYAADDLEDNRPKAGATPITDAYTAVGTYVLVVEWKPGNKNEGNYIITYNTATFTIVARELTLEWGTDSSYPAESVYGDPINLYNHLVVTATNSTVGVDGAFGKYENSKDQIVTLVASEEFGGEAIADFGDHTAQGTYFVAVSLTAGAGSNWVIHYTNTVDESWTYLIKKATIEEINAIPATVTGLTYRAEDQDIFETAPSARTINAMTQTWEYAEVKDDTVEASDVSAWKTMTGNNIKVYNAGKHYYIVKVSADNHNDLIKKVTVEVAQVKLTVRFNFEIMYGEANPVDVSYNGGTGYLFGELRNEAYKSTTKGWYVDGLVGDDQTDFYDADITDEQFYKLSYTAKYEVNGYVAADCNFAPNSGWVPTYYNVTFSNFVFECINYYVDFEGYNNELSRLFVDKITITLDGTTNQWVTYNDPGVDDKLKELNTEGVGYTVTHPNSSYGVGKYTTANDNYKDLTKVTSTAFIPNTANNAQSTTASVKSYPLIAGAKNEGDLYYVIVSGKNGSIEVKAATITITETVEGYNGDYTETAHGLLDKGSTEYTLATVSDKNNTLKVEYYLGTEEYDGQLPLTDSRLEAMTKIIGLPKYTDAGTYHIYYRASSDNYVTSYGYKVIIIKRIANVIDTDFNFANGTVKRIGNGVNIEDADTAWVYGYNNSNVEDDFKPDGNHVITPASTQYKYIKEGEKLKLKYVLYYYVSNTVGGNIVHDVASYESITELFNDVFTNKGFDAGYYVVNVSPVQDLASANFSLASVNYVFYVAPRKLTIKANDASTIYGEKAPSFTEAYSGGLVVGKKNAAADNITAVLEGKYVPYFVSLYGEGSDAGKYDITSEEQPAAVINDSSKSLTLTGIDGFSNYDVEYVAATLTVGKRTITITIDNYFNKYHLSDNKPLNTPTFTVASTSPYGIFSDDLGPGEFNGKYNNGNQRVIVLVTEAIVGDTTNSVKVDASGEVVPYTIYATFYFDVETQHSAETNYIVHFVGCKQKETNPDAIGWDYEKEPNAGEFTIEKAKYNMNFIGLYHKVKKDDDTEEEVKSNFYSGAKNYYKGNMMGAEEATVTFSYERLENGKYVYQDPDDLYNVGSYRVTASSDDTNYETGESSTTFEINQATIILTAKAATVQYGTDLSAGNIADDNKKGGIVEKGRFSGFEYEAASAKSQIDGKDMLIPSVVADYAANTVVGLTIGYKAIGYDHTTDAGKANLEIAAKCETTQNIKVEAPSATLTVEKRTVTVSVVGWDEANSGDKSKHNPHAQTSYQGTVSRLDSAFQTLFNNNRSSFIYTESLTDTFGANVQEDGTVSSAEYAKLNLTLSLPDNAVNVGSHMITAKQKSDSDADNNYDVTITNGKSDNALFSVVKAELTIYAGEYSGGAVKGYNSKAYGDSIATQAGSDGYADGFLRYYVDGMQPTASGELQSFYEYCLKVKNLSVNFTVTCDETGLVYAAWENTVDQHFTVSIDQFDDEAFDNYKITGYVTASLTLQPRLVTASVKNKDVDFEFDGTTFNNGLYGKEHKATIVFADPKVRDNATIINADKNMSYGLTYDTKELKKNDKVYQTAGGAPTVAGNYHVTVNLKQDGNYIFSYDEYDNTFDFNVNRMEISGLSWKDNPKQVSDSDAGTTFYNEIISYQNGYMVVSDFTFRSIAGSEMLIKSGNESTLRTYYYNSEGTLNLSYDNTAGRYSVRVALHADALVNNNVVLITNGEVAQFVTVEFDVTTDSVDLQVEYSDLIYGDEMVAPTVYINGGLTSSDNFSYLIVYISDTDSSKIDDYYELSKSKKGFSTDSGLRTRTIGSDGASVGYYLITVRTSAIVGDGQLVRPTRYYVFKIDPRPIEAPESLLDLPELSYNGGSLTFTASYDKSIMTPEFDKNPTNGVDMTEGDKSVTFSVVNAGTYYIRFRLNDSFNYIWNADKLPAGVTQTGDIISVKWEILVDDEDNALNPERGAVITLPEDAHMEYGTHYASDPANITILSGYRSAGTTVTVQYKAWTDVPVAEVTDDGWLDYDSVLPVGSYWIKVTVEEDPVRNFTKKYTIGKLTVEPKVIYAVVNGTNTYGEALENAEFTIYVDPAQLISGNPEEVNMRGWSVSYVDEANKYLNPQVGGTYYIILDTYGDNHAVIGVTVNANYIVMAEQGELTITPRDITVTALDEEYYIDYTVNPDLSVIRLSADVLAFGDTLEDLKLTVFTRAQQYSNTGYNVITVTACDNANYNVTNLLETISYFVIRPLEVEVQLIAQTGVYFGTPEDEIYGAKYDPSSLRITNADADVIYVMNNLPSMLQLLFTGTNNSGVTINQTYAPKKAGVYTVTLQGAGANYTLVGTPSVTFEIMRAVIDDTLFSIEPQTYTGDTLTPVITIAGNIPANLYTFGSDLPSFTESGTYDIYVSLTNPADYTWSSTSNESFALKFIIDKANDELISELTIKGWQYGNYSAAENTPFAAVKSGNQITYEYSVDGGKTYSIVIPETAGAGKYYVRASVAGSDNYNPFISPAVQFEISKFMLTAPTLITDATVYTGSELFANIYEFDSRYMSVLEISEARTFLGGAGIVATTVNAGVYKIFIAINDFANYGWIGEAGDAQGVITLTWEIAKKKVAKPTSGKNSFIVTGNNIVYIPEGFDERLMSIENNVYSYGGDFVAVVTLKDYANYEWENGGTTVEIKWHITGSDTLYAIIITVLLVLIAAGVAGVVAQLLLNQRRKRAVANAMNEIDSKDADANGDGAEEARHGENSEGEESSGEESAGGDSAEQAEESSGEDTPENGDEPSGEEANDASGRPEESEGADPPEKASENNEGGKE